MCVYIYVYFIFTYIYDTTDVCTCVFKTSNNRVIRAFLNDNDLLTNKLISFFQVVMASQAFTGVSPWNFLITVVTHNPNLPPAISGQ